jgi:hypothetical protein
MSDVEGMKQSFVRMAAVSFGTMLLAAAFAVAHFVYGVGWAVWGFVGFLAAGFAAQLWFIRGLVRTNRGT